MSWLSSAIDKGRKALGLPVISTSNIGALANAGAKIAVGGVAAGGNSWTDLAKEAASVVPGGNQLLSGISNFINSNPNGVSGMIQSAANNQAAAGNAAQTTSNLLHSPVFWLIVIAVLWFVMRKR